MSSFASLSLSIVFFFFFFLSSMFSLISLSLTLPFFFILFLFSSPLLLICNYLSRRVIYGNGREQNIFYVRQHKNPSTMEFPGRTGKGICLLIIVIIIGSWGNGVIMFMPVNYSLFIIHVVQVWSTMGTSSFEGFNCLFYTHQPSLFMLLCVFPAPYRTATARGKGEQADIAAGQAREDSEIARIIAKQFAPDFHQPGLSLQSFCSLSCYCCTLYYLYIVITLLPLPIAWSSSCYCVIKNVIIIYMSICIARVCRFVALSPFIAKITFNHRTFYDSWDHYQ